MKNRSKVGFLGLVLSAIALNVSSVSAAGSADEVNELLRGELSAVDTYEQALKKLDKEPGTDPLKTALANHKDAVKKLTAEVHKLNATPSTDAGAWARWPRPSSVALSCSATKPP